MMILIALVLLAFALPPCTFANHLYNEDRKFIKRNPRASIFFGIETSNQACRFITDTFRAFVILQGFCIGLISDIVLTPLILIIEAIGILVGVPYMIYRELEQRNKIHR